MRGREADVATSGEDPRNLRTLQPSHESLEVAATEGHTLDANDLTGDAKEDYITADHGQPGILADLRPQLVQQGRNANPTKLFTNLLKEADCPTRIVLSDPVCDFFEIPFDIG